MPAKLCCFLSFFILNCSLFSTQKRSFLARQHCKLFGPTHYAPCRPRVPPQVVPPSPVPTKTPLSRGRERTRTVAADRGEVGRTYNVAAYDLKNMPLGTARGVSQRGVGTWTKAKKRRPGWSGFTSFRETNQRFGTCRPVDFSSHRRSQCSPHV